ncbi:major facilitator superfamily domain-containing protein, partial [Pelagophyceae sp. CCMP2097]
MIMMDRGSLGSSCSSYEDAAYNDAREKVRVIRRLKFLYFWTAIGPSSWGRYAPVYYNACGLSPAKISIIEGAMPFVRGLSMPCWGLVADRARRKKAVALLTQGCGVGCLMLLAWRKLTRDAFAPILAISLASACFASSGVVDAFTLEALGPAARGRFGEVRLWSAVSWGICNVLMGYCADSFGGFEINLAIFGCCTCITILVFAFSLKEQRAPIKTLLDPPESYAPLDGDAPPPLDDDGFAEVAADSVECADARSARPIFTFDVVLFFVEVTVFGACTGVVESLLFVYIIQDLGGSYGLCGLTVAFTVAVEIPLFAVSERLLKTLGHDLMFAMAMAAYIPRVWAYTVITRETKFWILLPELLHGPTFALMYAASVDFAAKTAPPGYEARFQTLQNACRTCVGTGIGVLAAGTYWEASCTAEGQRRACRGGAVRMYRGAGAIMSVMLAVHLCKWAAQVRRRAKRRSGGEPPPSR